MSKRRPPWGLMGLLGLGGLLMLGAGGDDDATSGGSGGSGGDDPGGGGSGGSGDSGNPDDPDEPGTFQLADLPQFTPEPDPNNAPVHKRPKYGKNKWGKGQGPQRPKPDDDLPGNDLPPYTPPSPPPGDPPPPQDPPPPEDPPPPVGPPWSELVDPYPRGARFYLVQQGDRFGGTHSKRSIAYRYLLSEAYLAAVEVGELEHEDALAWALGVGKQDKVRLEVIDLIQCSGWNDAMYGSNPVNVSHASPHGRSIRLTPVHGPTEQQLREGQTPFRNVTMHGNPADGDYRHYELLWLPAIDRVVLWESGGSAITTTNMVWDDGTSMENPPPWVMALGMGDLSDALSGDFGCPGSDGELEVAQ